MTPEAKIWSILKNINDDLAIAPSGEPVFVDTKEIEKWVKREDQEQIFEKLAKDSKLFEIQEKPDYKKSFRYVLLVTNNDEFRKAINEAHIRHFGSIEMLGGDNFLAVVDVAADILEALELQATNIAVIPLQRSLIRFQSLCPANYPNFRDRYCDLRWKALGYLKSNQHIEDFALADTDDLPRWEYEVKVLVDRVRFTNFYEKLLKVYKKRVKFPNKETEQKTAATIPEPPTQKIEIVKGKMEIEGLEKGLGEIAKAKKEDDKPKFPHKLPAGTKWEEITIKFLDDENVYIQVKQFKHNASYKELGLVGKGNNPNPSELWAFLKVLAQVNGELAIKDAEARDKYKKQKELLAKSLQSYFSLDYDPFYPYRSSFEKSGNSYKIKITLIPPTSRDKIAKIVENDDDLGFKEFYTEQTPQVYEG